MTDESVSLVPVEAQRTVLTGRVRVYKQRVNADIFGRVRQGRM